MKILVMAALTLAGAGIDPPRIRVLVGPSGATVVASGGRTVRMELIGARGDAPVVAGRDSVLVRRVWPGVDVRYYVNARGALEHDFIVAPGADPDVVRFRADDAELGDDGSLRAGAIGWAAPVTYQIVNGSRVAVASRYEARADGTYGFVLSPYDRSRELVIDPEMIYPHAVSGVRVADIAHRAGTDEVVVVGSSDRPDLPVVNAAQSVFGGVSDVVVLRSSGDATLHFTYYGGSGWDTATAVAMDAAGNAYVTGSALSPDFPATATLAPAGGSFVLKIAPDGTVVYAIRFAGERMDAIAVDGRGAAYVAGRRERNGQNDAVVVKINPAGTGIEYEAFLGGPAWEAAAAIAVNAAGEAFVAGVTESEALATTGAFQTAAGRGFVARLRADGAGVAYWTYFPHEVSCIALQGDRAVIGGGTGGGAVPAVNAVQPTPGGSSDGYVAVLSANGSALEMSTYLGGFLGESVQDVEAGPNSIVAVGYRSWQRFADTPPFPLVEPLYRSQIDSHFVTLIQTAPEYRMAFSTLLPGEYRSGTQPSRVATDPADVANRIYVAGMTSSRLFPAATLGEVEFQPFTANLALVEGFFARLSTRTGACAPKVWTDHPLGGQTALHVVSPSGCEWTLQSSAPWLRPQRDAGFGIDSMWLEAEANPGATRSAMVTVSPGGASVTYTQPGAGCNYALDPQNVRLGLPGESATVALQTSEGCPWTVGTPPSWFSVRQTSGERGSGPAAFGVVSNGWFANENSFALRVGNRVMFVTRPACGIGFTEAESRVRVGAEGAVVEIPVKAAAGCPWRASADGLPVEPASATGPTVVRVTIPPHLGNDATYAVRIGSGIVWIDQAGQPCRYQATPAAARFGYYGGAGSFRVVTQGWCGWSAVDGMGARIGQGQGPAEVRYTAPFNDQAGARSHLFEIRDAGGRAAAGFTVVQEPLPPRIPQALPMTAAAPWTFRFADADGADDLAVLKVRFGAHLDDSGMCEVTYRRSTDRFQLEPGGPELVSGAGVASIATSRCRLNAVGPGGGRSVVTREGNRADMTLWLDLLDQRRMAIYVTAWDRAGNMMPWTPVGVHTPPGAGGVTVTPAEGGFDREAFVFRVPAGSRVLSVLMNDRLDPRFACYFGYEGRGPAALLLNDEGRAYAVGTGDTFGTWFAENRQCVVSAETVGPRVAPDGSITVHVQFKAAFSGSRLIYVSAQEATGASTGWEPAGFYRVNPQP
ncbi:MAG: hypothetical protein R2729_23230 [Bryobacteraceae bacterium]